MKRFIAIVVLIGLVALGAWYFLKPSPERVMPAEMLPADTLLMVEVTDLKKRIDNFKSSKLGENLRGIDLIGVMEELEAPAEISQEVKKAKSAVLSIVDSILFKELFGQETVLTLLPVEFDQSEPEELKRVLASVVLISRPKHNAEFIQFMSRIFTKKIEYHTSTYAGYEIKGSELQNDITVYHTMADGLLVITFDQQTLKECLDLRKNQQSSLAKNEYYQDLHGKLVSSETKDFVYNNTQKMFKNFSEILQSLFKEEKAFADMERSLENLEGLKSIGFTTYNDGSDLLQNKMLTMIDRNALKPLYARAYSFKPMQNNTLQMAPNNALVYYWINNLDLRLYLDLYLENEPLDEEKIEAMKSGFEKVVGVSLDHIFDAIGNQFGLVMTDINTDGFFPIPKLTIFAEVKENDTVLKLIDSVTQKSGIEIQNEKFDGVEINYFILPFGNDIQPAYTFLNEFCIVSINPQLIKDIISTYKNGNNITTDQDFQSVNKGLTDKNNSVIFIKFYYLIDKVKGLVDWGCNMMANRDQVAADRANIVADKVITPVFNGLKMYKNIGIRSFLNKEDSIEAMTFYTIDK